MLHLATGRPPLVMARFISVACVLASCFIALAQTKAYDYGFDVDQRLGRRSSQLSSDSTPYVVTGINVNNSEKVPVRQEIRQLQRDPELWTLYLLGLSMMQYTDQSQLLSYYQIAGIHGVPWAEWNGVAATPGNQNTGYCTHISELFLTWHRPYLVLYEQVLYSLIQFIASLYTEPGARRRYLAAADRFRIPYMDWAAQPPAGESVLPESVGGSPFVNVSGPNGAQVIANPLYTYTFKPLNATMFIEPPYDLWLTTVRAPTAQDASAGSNNTQVSMALSQSFQSIQQRLYNLFSNYQNFSTFGNEAWIPASSNGTYDSLESLHDTIHTLSGLQGHMAWIPFSAFDPIFFLHHCMVDRIFAMWQILNPGSWVRPTSATSNSFTTSAGQMQDSQTPLTPFYKTSNGTFWTSDDVRDMSVFGYTYDDMTGFPQSSLILTNTTTQAQVKSLINRLYGSSSPAAPSTVTKNRMAVKRDEETRIQQGRWGILQLENQSVVEGAPNSLRNLTELEQLPASIVDNQYREWVANVHVAKQALGASFSLYIFLGDLPTDPNTWAYASNLVGTLGVFASPGGRMAGRNMGGGHTSGTIPLTSALAGKISNGELASLEPAEAGPYLRSELHYGIMMMDGRVVEPEEVAGLGITVISACVQGPSSVEELPQWGEVESHFDLI